MKNIHDSSHQYLLNVTIGASLAFQMREKIILENWTLMGVIGHIREASPPKKKSKCKLFPKGGRDQPQSLHFIKSIFLHLTLTLFSSIIIQRRLNYLFTFHLITVPALLYVNRVGYWTGSPPHSRLLSPCS